MKLKSVKIFGERNTSTNALKQLIETNSDFVVKPGAAKEVSPTLHFGARAITKVAGTLGHQHFPLAEQILDLAFRARPPSATWKHCATDFSDITDLAGHVVLVCVRHPGSWLLALHRRPYNALVSPPKRFEDFLDMAWKTVGRDRLYRATMTPPELYNRKIESYRVLRERVEAAGGTFAYVRFEDFAVDQLGLLRQLPFRVADSIPVEKSTKSRDNGKDREYYGKEMWRSEISALAENKLRDAIDWARLSPFHYEI